MGISHEYYQSLLNLSLHVDDSERNQLPASLKGLFQEFLLHLKSSPTGPTTEIGSTSEPISPEWRKGAKRTENWVLSLKIWYDANPAYVSVSNKSICTVS